MSKTLSRLPVVSVLALGVLAAAGPADNVRILNGRLQDTGVRDALALLRSRAASFQEVLRTDPGEALRLELPPAARGRFVLLPGAAPFVESDGTWSGQLRTYIEDGAGGRARRVHQLVTGTETLDIQNVPAAPRPACGQTAEIQGVRLGRTVAARTLAVRSPAQDAAASPCSSAAGDRRIAVILLSFPSTPLPGGAAALAQTVFFGGGHSLDAYWRENSYGKTSASGAVFGPFTTDQDYSCADPTSILRAGLAAAQGSVKFGDYAHIYFVFPQNGGCAVGTGSVGCWQQNSPQGTINAGFAWLPLAFPSKPDELAAIAAHEGGHNLGLEHAGSVDFGTEPLGPAGAPGNFDEYGDRFSTMGIVWAVGSTFGFGHYAAPQKAQLGWLEDGVNLQTVQTSGTVTIRPYESAGSGLQALRIQRGTGGSSWLWVEYRRPLGPFDPSLAVYSPSAFNGALIHYDDPSDTANGGYSKLLTFDPGSFNDAPLGPGQSWKDPYTNLSLQVESATPDALSFIVTYSAVAAPQIAASASAVSAADGSAAVAPGGILSIYGSGLASGLQKAGAYPLPASLVGTSVEVLSAGTVRNAPLYFVSPSQINAQLPYATVAPAQIRVRTPSGASQAFDLPQQAAAPRLFTSDMSGTGVVAALRLPDYAAVAADTPVRAGDSVVVYGTGFGAVSPPVSAGAPAGDGTRGNALSQCSLPVTATIGGVTAQVLWAGLAPGFAGLYQVNLVVPSGIPPGPQPIVVQTGGVASQSGVTLPVSQ